MKNVQSGFTLVELMVVVAILGILLGIGVPGMSQVLASSRVSSAASEFQLALQGARSLALTQRERYTVCPADAAKCADSESWSAGWATYKGGADGVRVQQHVLSGVDVISDTDDFSFNAMGYLEPAVPRTITLSANDGQAQRWLCVSASGKASVSRSSCEH